MHELGIVFHIIRTVEDVARQNDVTRIRRVTLQLGEVSGVKGADGTRRVLPYPDEALRRGGMEEVDSVDLTDGILRKV